MEKKDEKKKMTKENAEIVEKAKKFFNNPVPLIVVLIVIICILLYFISQMNTKAKIYVGKIDVDGLQVGDVHYFTNNDMNYFFSSNPVYSGEDKDKKVYSYQIGYYAFSPDGEKHEFATRSKEADKGVKLSEVMDELGGWSFAENYNKKYFFTDDVIRNMDNLYFVVKASTNKDSKEADIIREFKVELVKISK